MADTTFVSSQQALDAAILAQTQLADSVMHLFQSTFTPTPTTPLSSFQAAEATFDSYAPATIAAWSEIVLAGAAYALFAPTQTFEWVYVSGINNTIGGYWIQLAGGDLNMFVIFNPGESVAGPYQAIVRTPLQIFPWG
jgi:hypothetical protein